MPDKTTTKVNLFGLPRADMDAFFADMGEKSFRSSQVLKWIHHFSVDQFDEMTNLSKVLRERLKEVACISSPEVVERQVSSDGTQKWLVRLDNNNCVETVFIPEGNRGTLCVSSQIGCALNCSFCATGKQGFNRNLSAAEIIAQIWVANRELGRDPKDERIISNIVMMGMGEPLLNFNNVVAAMNIMMDDNAYGLSKRRVTISTSGVVPALERLKAVSDVALAVSLHATNDELRNELVPINKKYPIKQLLNACKYYVKGEHKRKVTFEYVMLDGVNDKPQHARELVALIKDIPSKVNLIPLNPFPNSGYKCSSTAAIEKFRNILMKSGVISTTRKTRGDDIDAACGQLAGKVMDKTKRRFRREEIKVDRTNIHNNKSVSGRIL